MGIALGQAFAQSLGDKKGITRYGDKILPMDEALILSAVDLSGRGYLGYELEIKIFTEYPLPNPAVADGQLDANYFQHQPYLDDFNAQNGTKVVTAAAIHVEPMGLYGGQQTTLDALIPAAE